MPRMPDQQTDLGFWRNVTGTSISMLRKTFQEDILGPQDVRVICKRIAGRFEGYELLERISFQTLAIIPTASRSIESTSCCVCSFSFIFSLVAKHCKLQFLRRRMALSMQRVTRSPFKLVGKRCWPRSQQHRSSFQFGQDAVQISAVTVLLQLYRSCSFKYLFLPCAEYLKQLPWYPSTYSCWRSLCRPR